MVPVRGHPGILRRVTVPGRLRLLLRLLAGLDTGAGALGGRRRRRGTWRSSFDALLQ